MKAEMTTVEINGVEYIRKDTMPKAAEINTDMIALIRTDSAGVHFGELVSRNGKEVTLKNARRLYYWEGACSLSQAAIDGVDLLKSRISIVVPSITLTEAIEVIPMSKAAAESMMAAKPWKV